MTPTPALNPNPFKPFTARSNLVLLVLVTPSSSEKAPTTDPSSQLTAARPATCSPSPVFPGEEVVVSGAENVPGTWYADGDAYRLDWPYDALWHRYEGPSDPFGEARRRDVLIADGQMLLAVYNRSDLREGTFFLEGSPYNPTTMYTILPGRKDPNQALMQTSRTNHLFNPSTNESHCRFGDPKGYYHLIGITFRHTANDGLLGAVCPGTEGSVLENLTSEWTNGAGFLISGSNHVVRGVRALSNGMSGYPRHLLRQLPDRGLREQVQQLERLHYDVGIRWG